TAAPAVALVAQVGVERLGVGARRRLLRRGAVLVAVVLPVLALPGAPRHDAAALAGQVDAGALAEAEGLGHLRQPLPRVLALGLLVGPHAPGQLVVVGVAGVGQRADHAHHTQVGAGPVAVHG